MINSIESSIIAYFDNRLSDAERVDLLRQVNESEDARRLFRQHEVLRSLVQRAQARTVVDADTETLLLSKIAPVARPWIYQAFPSARTFAGALAASALVFLGIYLIKPTFNSSDKPGIQQITSLTSQSVSDGANKSYVADNRIRVNQSKIAIASKTRAIAFHVTSSPKYTTPQSSAVEPATIEPALIFACRMPEQPSASISDSKHSNNDIHPLSSIAESISGSTNNIRVSLQADSPPINDRHFPGVSGGSGSVGYFITPSDILSARFGFYESRLLPPSSESIGPLASIKHNDHFTSILSAGIAIEHQVMAYDGRLIISGSIGAGLQSYGNYLSANISAVTPIFGNVLSGIGVSVSRQHFSTSTWAVQDAASPSGFSQWTNAEASNFVTAKIYYMVSYGF